MKLIRFFKNNLSNILTIIFMASVCGIALYFDRKAGIYTFAVFGCYLLFFNINLVVTKRGRGNWSAVQNTLNSGSSIMVLNKIEIPVALIDQNEKILWHNTAFRDMTGEEYIKLKNMITELGVTVSGIKAAAFRNEYTFKYEKNNKHYNVRISPFDVSQQSYLLFWNDVSENILLQQKIKEKNTVIAYAVVDNISELTQGVQDTYRESSAKIGKILTEWVASMDGLIKEYERDKFIIVFEEKHLSVQLENKFDILDSINDNSFNSSSVPITISLGLACTEGSLSEKENTAKQSLQLALQRGGAQAVIKINDESEIFGGRTKTAQKLTKIKSRVVASELVAAIKSAGNILIMGHKNADFDSIGSNVGIARLAMFLGKEVNIIVNHEDEAIITAFAMLSGNADYKSVFIDSVYGQDKIRSDTLLVITDTSNSIIFESPEIYKNSGIVAIIDHHRQVSEFERQPDILYIEPTASSASELVSEILEYTLPPMTLEKEESELLLAGILLDTQNFSRNVGPRTFSAAVFLRTEGGNPGKAQGLFKYKLNDYKKQAEFERNIITFRKIFAISQYDFDNDEENRVISAQTANRMLMIEGIRASFVISLVGNAVHISARSDGSVNVSLILEKLKGGGHFDSAGARLTGISMKQAAVMLRDAIVDYCEKEK